MTIVADQFEFVVGVDTHKRSHSVAVIDDSGAVRSQLRASTDPQGLDRLVAAVIEAAPGRRLWAIEQTGSYGAGLAMLLDSLGEQVVEIDRPARPARRSGAKDDDLDALRAAREALTREALATPRCRGSREAMRVLLATRRAAVHARTAAICQLKALVVTAPIPLRESLRGLHTHQLIRTCCRLHLMQRHDDERRGTVLSLRATARRIEQLSQEVAQLETELERLIKQLAPGLLDQPGIGIITGTQVLVSWSHRGRIRTEAAFAAMAGTAPIPASSGETVRHRLNRSGDRQLNRALHNIVLSRMRHHDQTIAYVARRRSEGRTTREIQRCLKRTVARQLFRLLESGRHLNPA